MVKGWRDVMVMFGLGKPVSRAFVAGVAAAGLAYTAGFPKAAFDDEGGMRPFALLSPGPDSVYEKHFLVVPVAVATAVYLFT